MTLSTTDRLDILDLLARADLAARRRDADAYVALFTDDPVLAGAMGEHRGREALRRAVGPIWQAEGAASVHLTLNAVVDAVADQPNRARATSMLLIVGETPTSLQNVSVIVQEVVKGDGRWRIHSRTVSSVSGPVY
jgi:ketosteroid isomerase-like protein